MSIETLGVEECTHPTFTREVNQNTARMEYLVNPDAQALDNFFCYMVGGVSLPNNVLGLSRLLPQVLTYAGVQYNDFGAVKIEEAKGHVFTFDDTTSNPYPIPNYTKFRVRVLFQQFPFYLANDDQITSESQRYLQQLPSQSQVDYLSLAGSVGRYVNYPGQPVGNPGTLIIPYGTGFPIASTVISYKWIRLPYAAWGVNSLLYSTIYGDQVAGATPLVGTVNSNDFLGYPPGVLLMLAPEEELVIDQASGLSWNLTYKFLVKWQGHNFFYFFPSGSAAGNGAGWYFANISPSTSPFYNQFYTPATLPDGVSYFNARNFNVIWQP
jgi:hypothetical protein